MIIRDNNQIAASKIAKIVGCSVPTVYRNLKLLGIHWEGHSKTGHWIFG